MLGFSVKPIAKLGVGYAPAFSPSGRYLITMPSTAAPKLFSVDDWQLVGRLDGVKYPRFAAFDASDSTVFIASVSEMLAEFPVDCVQMRNRWRIAGGVEANGLELSPDGQSVFHSAWNPHVTCFSVCEGQVIDQLVGTNDPRGQCRGIVITADKRFLVAAFKMASNTAEVQSEVVAWSLPDRQLVRRLTVFDPPQKGECVQKISSTAQPNVVAVASDRGLSICDIEAGKVLVHRDGLHHADCGELAIAFSGCGQFAAVGNHNRVDIYDQEISQSLGTLEISPEGIYGIAFSPDSKYMAVSNGSTYVWELAQLV